MFKNIKNNKTTIFKFFIYNILNLLLFIGYWYFDILICKSFIYWVIFFWLTLHVFFIIFALLCIINYKLLKSQNFDLSKINIDDLKRNYYIDIILMVLTTLIEFFVLWCCDYFIMAYILIGVISTSILMYDCLLGIILKTRKELKM